MLFLQQLNPTSERVRRRAYMNVLVGAINAALERCITGSEVGENLWPDAAKTNDHTFRFELSHDIAAAAQIMHLGGVMRLNVAAWPNSDLGWLGTSTAGPDAGEAFVLGTLNRAEHLWLKDEFTGSYIAKARLRQLAGLSIKPAGYLLGSYTYRRGSRAIHWLPLPDCDHVTL